VGVVEGEATGVGGGGAGSLDTGGEAAGDSGVDVDVPDGAAAYDRAMNEPVLAVGRSPAPVTAPQPEVTSASVATTAGPASRPVRDTPSSRTGRALRTHPLRGRPRRVSHPWPLLRPPDVTHWTHERRLEMRIAVAGGTGVLGRHVVAELARRGHDPVVMSRSTGVDVTTGAGLDAALVGADVVIDATSVTTMSRRTAEQSFEAGTGELVRVGRRAGVRHHVAVSIVGVDRAPEVAYYGAKLHHEELVLAGPVPSSILRATQFHEFPGQFLDRFRGPVVPVFRMLTQPVAAREVASALVDVAEGPPRGHAGEIAGPEVHELVDLARRVVRARGQRRLVVGIRAPGAAGRKLVEGAALPTVGGLRGRVTFDEWLAGHVAGPPRVP
jgi:uncharacterized protein YbjT (DUF2867 family)